MDAQQDHGFDDGGDRTVPLFETDDPVEAVVENQQTQNWNGCNDPQASFTTLETRIDEFQRIMMDLFVKAEDPRYMSPYAATTFPRFTELSQEIQNVVWELTIHPRIIEIALCGESHSKDQYFTSVYPLPSAMVVHRASREAVMRLYPRCFNSYIHVNFAIDTVYLDQSFDESVLKFFDSMTDKDRNGLRDLAIHERCGDDKYDIGDNLDPVRLMRYWWKVWVHMKALPKLNPCKWVIDIRNAALKCNPEMGNIESDLSKQREFFASVPREIMEEEHLAHQPALRYIRMDTPGLGWNGVSIALGWKLGLIDNISVQGPVPIQPVYGWRRGTQKLPWLHAEKAYWGRSKNWRSRHRRLSC